MASERFKLALDKHTNRYKVGMNEHEIAEAAYDAKLEAEAKFAIRISITCDVDGNWWFQ